MTYGTPRSRIREMSEKQKEMLLRIPLNGILEIKGSGPHRTAESLRARSYIEWADTVGKVRLARRGLTWRQNYWGRRAPRTWERLGKLV